MDTQLCKILPNDLIIKIIKMKVEEDRKDYWKTIFTEEVIDEIKMVHEPLYFGGIKGYFQSFKDENIFS